MPQITGAISLNDGQATPVAVSFTPETITPEKVVFVDRSGGVPAAFRRLTLTMKRSSVGKPTTAVSIEFSYPEISNVGGVITVLHTGRYASGKFIIPDTMSAAARAHLLAFVRSALNSSLVYAYVRELESAW